MQTLTLEREIHDASYKSHHEKGVFVGSVPLLESYIDDIDTFYVRQHISIDDVDILISIENSNGALETGISSIVNQFLKHINCRLTVAFH
ncbi:hypothetical protein EYS14_14390 [Alteromonadaceae bacterium M269]|nr:hypothetical protein EYS14_14390 [Alteromonadaceae bacterium M269]